MSVRINFEIGHEACIRSKRTIDGFTHDWHIYVQGLDGADISYYVEKVIFMLHETFPNPKRVIKDPPYSVRESGYAGFVIPIEIHLRNNEEPKKLRFSYDLNLQPTGPAINKFQREKYVFPNPSEDFRHKLIKGGGVIHLESNREVVTEKHSKPKVSSSTDAFKKHKIKEHKAEDSFTDLFGTPITKTSKISPEPVIPVKNSPSNSVKTDKSSSSKKSKSKHSPKEKDKEREKDKEKKEKNPEKKHKEEKKNKERNKDKERKDKSSKRERSPKQSPSPRRSPKRSSSPPKRAPSPKRPPSPPIKVKTEEKKPEEPKDKVKSEKPKRDKDKEKEKKEHKSHKEKQNREQKEHKKEKPKDSPQKQKEKPVKTEVPEPPPVKEPEKAKPEKVENVEKTDKIEKPKHKHKKKSDKEKKEERREKKDKKSEKKLNTEKIFDKVYKEEPAKESPKEDKTKTPESENNILREKTSSRNLNVLQSQFMNDSSNSSASHDESSLETPKVEKTEKKKERKPEGTEKKRKRKHETKEEPPKIEEPPVKITREEPEITETQEEKKENVEQEITQDYMSILKELQHKIMTLQDNVELQRVVQLIAETGHYEITAQTFDFDLCALDRDTVRRLQEFFTVS